MLALLFHVFDLWSSFFLSAITQSWENLGGNFQTKENGDTRSKKVHIAGLFQIFGENVISRMLYFTPWIWKVAHPSTKYFPKKTSRMKQDMHLFELIFLQNVLYFSSKSGCFQRITEKKWKWNHGFNYFRLTKENLVLVSVEDIKGRAN